MGEGYEDYVFKNKERGDKRWTISIAGFVVIDIFDGRSGIVTNIE